VLRFNCYFQESVVERADEQFRIRECTLLYYLEDDTLQINESVTSNSGMPQGVLVRRQAVSKTGQLPSTLEEAELDDTFQAIDFNVGKEVTIFGRTYRITDCDSFTRTSLTKMGLEVPQPEETPSNPHTVLLETAKAAQTGPRPYQKIDTLGKFLEYDRKVLRFYALWDDSASPHGEKRYMVLHYYLVDDTIELCEKLPANSGRDNTGSFFRRGKLPKDVKALSALPGAKTPRTVLNTIGDVMTKNRHILDNRDTGKVVDEFYTDSDLIIGSHIDVLGRHVLLCDADPFTKSYYESKYDMKEFQVVDVSDPPAAQAIREVPPPTGCVTERINVVHQNVSKTNCTPMCCFRG